MDINEVLKHETSRFLQPKEEISMTKRQKRKRDGEGPNVDSSPSGPIGVDVKLYFRTREELAAKEQTAVTAESTEPQKSRLEVGVVQAVMAHLKRWEGLVGGDAWNEEDLATLELARLAKEPAHRPVSISDDVKYCFTQEDEEGFRIEVQVTRLHPATLRRRLQLAAVDVKKFLVSKAIASTVAGCGDGSISRKASAPHASTDDASATHPGNAHIQLFEGMDTNIEDLLA